MGLEGVIQGIVDDVEHGRFTVASLEGDGNSCDWVFTIGLSRCYSHPELILIGLVDDLGALFVQSLGDDIAQGRVIAPYEEVEITEGVVMTATPVDNIWLRRGEWFSLGRAVMDAWGVGWPDTLQLVWRDASGARPEVPGSPEWMLRQPLLNEEMTGALKPRPWLW